MSKILALLLAGFGMTLASCSDEPEVSLSPDDYINGSEIVRHKVNSSFFTDYENGKLSGSFKLEMNFFYHRNESTNWKWAYPDMVFATSQDNNISRTRIYISGGQIWESAENLFNYYYGYSSSFYSALAQVNVKLGTNYMVLIGRPVEFDAETKTMKVKYRDYEVLGAEKGRLTLAKKDILYGGGEYLEIFCYQWTDEAIDLTSDNLKKFASNAEAFDWLIDLYFKNFDVTEEYKNFTSVNTIINIDNPNSVYAWLLYERELYSRQDTE
ncbi:MAG: hypothetical protein K2K84_10000 [Muribaculaceae bacterium]|nr:hypothetical protein [Muribaculaceae bacterium]